LLLYFFYQYALIKILPGQNRVLTSGTPHLMRTKSWSLTNLKRLHK